MIMLRSPLWIIRQVLSTSHKFNVQVLPKCIISSVAHLTTGVRTHTCGELNEKHVGKHVILCGWLYSTRVSNTFLLIKDCYGLTQVLVDPTVCS